MATEGQFPKSPGDILFASEANRFAESKFIATGSFPLVASGTAFQDLGSVNVAANTLLNPSSIKGHLSTSLQLKVILSGLSKNFEVFTGSTGPAQSETGIFQAFIGSPMVCGMTIQLQQSDSNILFSDALNSSHFDATEAFTIKFQGKNSAGTNRGLSFYLITAEGQEY